MLLVALTGGIATGKSLVGNIFRQLGCTLFLSDQIARQLTENGTPAWEVIVRRFGKSILNPDGSIDRKKLGRRVFRSREERTFLNRLLHPLVFQSRQTAIEKAEMEGRNRIFITEAALTIEAGYMKYNDRVVVTFCPRDLQLERLINRDGITRDEALRKIESQMPVEEKKEYADYVIDTSSSIRETLDQTEQVFRYLVMNDHWFYSRRKPISVD